MTIAVQDLPKAARSLPPDQQAELLQGIAQLLAQAVSPLAPASTEFWAHRSIEEIARQQGAHQFVGLESLAMPDWPPDESADDIIAFIREQRRMDRDGRRPMATVLLDTDVVSVQIKGDTRAWTMRHQASRANHCASDLATPQAAL
jgi:hypothetical protein